MGTLIIRFGQILVLLLGFGLQAQPQLSFLGTLPQEIRETSGLMFYNGKVYTHNDSGSEAVIYEIDTLNFSIRRTIQINGAQNIDWEDLARDERYLYIGDIGNNLGARTDLRIYRVLLSELDTGTAATAEVISYSYADQTVFDAETDSDWDAEALISYGDELIVFTKQWQSLGTVAYTLPKTPGDYIAQRAGSNAINGLVTGAAYHTGSEVVYFVGYSTLLQPFLYRLTDLATPFSLTGSGQRFNLDIGFAQIEAIAAIDENNYLLSSEAFSRDSPPITLNPSLFSLQTEDIVEEPEDNGDTGEETVSTQLSVFVPFGTKTLEYTLQTNREVIGWEIFDTTGRRVDGLIGDQNTGNQIDISALSSSVYYLAFYLRGTTIAKPFFLD
ncbi:hypothetical protein [Lentiprolixibacter aurantiacus]|uniref:Secretion system C-terminal sorting domain-containing protein n=1 Tax=Lentiprolixibacter aurantiacus TaxID=2993939 RepID=A0AAE3MLT6_9FLAO|nr:hypothetical protein [Lentiprolixibacter aurantiacus]MCX2719788.1 hypothetical protein [Lentiprolixibacter aurantiacus]